MQPTAVAPVTLTVPSIHGAGAGTARVAARAAGATRTLTGLGFFSAHGEAGKLLAELFAFAPGTFSLLAAQHDGFKMVVTTLADVLKNRHSQALG